MQHLSVRVQAVCSFPPSLTTSKTRRRSKPPTTILQIWLNLYCPPQKAEICGDFLSKSNMFLQHPEYPEPGLLYQNPQVMSPEFSIITKCEPQGGLTHLGVTEESQVSKLGELDAIDTLNLFRGLDGGDSLSGPPVDSRIRTTLMECVHFPSQITIG